MHTARFYTMEWSSPEGTHQLGYREWGNSNNPHLLLAVHGLTRTGEDFETLAQQLSPHLRIIAPDIPGRGRSDRFKNSVLYNIPIYIQACLALIEGLSFKTLDWLGTSMGGLIGMGIASLPQSPIHKLILNDVGPHLNLQALQRIASYLGQPVLFQTLQEGRDYLRKISLPFGEHTESQWNQLCDSMLVHTPNGWTTHYDPAIALGFKELSAETLAQHEQALWHAWHAITAETLIIRGAQSDLLSKNTVEHMQKQGPHTQFSEIPNVGHAPTFMNLHQIRIVQDFLL